MNTLTSKKAILEQTGRNENVILLEALEFGMPKKQLKAITNLHNGGMSLEDISEQVERNVYEVLIALIHQVNKGCKLRPLAFRRN